TYTINHFIVRQYCAKGFAPVDFPITTISKTILHEDILSCFFIKSLPVSSREMFPGDRQLEIAVRYRVIYISCAFECSSQYFNTFCLIRNTVIKTFEQFQKDPLRPFVKCRIRSTHLPVPVETETN